MNYEDESVTGREVAVQTTKNLLAVSTVGNVTNEKLIEDAYYGSGGFLDGSYLIPHRRERAGKYNERRLNSYFLNYTQTVINSHVDPVFNGRISRDHSANQLLDSFLRDVDGDGSDIGHFMKQAGLVAKMKGMAAIVVDNFEADQLPQTVAETIEMRKFAYAFILEPEDIISYKLNRFGQVTEITYNELPSSVDGNTTKKSTVTWTPGYWKRTDEEGKETGEMPNPLGRVPVVILKSRKTSKKTIKPISEFISIVKTNLRIFNLCSELDELLRNQAFSILRYPGHLGANPTASAQSNQEITLGTDNILGYSPESSTAPDYIAPPTGPADTIMKQIDRLIQEIYRMAVLSHVTGVESQKSGIAKQWDFQKTSEVLSDYSENCETAENQVVGLFAAWSDITTDYNAIYPRDFSIVEILEELDKALRALELQIGGKFNLEVKKLIARIYFSHFDPEGLQEILDDIEQNYNDPNYIDVHDPTKNVGGLVEDEEDGEDDEPPPGKPDKGKKKTTKKTVE